jgi:hypothetical protein
MPGAMWDYWEIILPIPSPSTFEKGLICDYFF